MMELCGMCSVTDGSGKASELFSSKHRRTGTYRLRFETGEYFVRCGMETPYPYIDVSISSTVVCGKTETVKILSCYDTFSQDHKSL